MTVDHGMNIEEVKALAEHLKSVAHQLEQVTQLINGRVTSTSWVGPDATRFKNEWWPGHRTQLQKVFSDLDGFGQSAMNNATEQERASEGGNDGGGSAAFPAPAVAVGVVAGGVGAALAGGATTPAPVTPAPAGPLGGDEAGLRSAFQGAYRHDHYGQDGTSYDRYNFAYNQSGNCTSYVAWRLNALAAEKGVPWTMSNNHVGDVKLERLGNAHQWGSNAGSIGFPPDKSPQAGAVAFWDANGGKSSYGHVGVVHAVRADGTIEVEESSWGSSVFSIKTYAPGQKGYPTGFLHLMPGS